MQSVQAVPVEGLGDAELVERARRNDAAAYRTIIQRHNQRLYRLVRSILRDPVEAEDALQEVYLSAFAALGGFRGGASLSTWLTRIAMNEALGRLRRRKVMSSLDDEEVSGSVIPFPLAQPSAADPEHSAARAEIRCLLETAIDELPVPFRTVFMMRAVEQMSTEEVAAVLDIPEETVKTRFHRAKRRLRDAVDDQLENALGEAFPFAGARCERIAARVLERLGLGPPPR
jgi:RNA polymerase sigma-70 factor, ECF subfamily